MLYGVANTSGMASKSEVAKILEKARLSGITRLDTAISYGSSETVLGELNVADFKIITKLPPLSPESNDFSDEWITTHVDKSIERLKISQLEALLLHDPKSFLGKYGLFFLEALQALKLSGKVRKIGISIYDPEDLGDGSILEFIDVIQFPFNVFDRRMLDSALIPRIKKRNIELHARSIFLQGLLLMKPEDRPKYFNQWQHLFSKWDAMVANNEGNGLHLCLENALSNSLIDGVIVGVDSEWQLNQIIQQIMSLVDPREIDLSANDSCLTNPSKWKTW
jgi:aryl-alcohol dehydrogenase-like predicted oxidoreductase